jgi:hypothetical protein
MSTLTHEPLPDQSRWFDLSIYSPRWQRRAKVVGKALPAGWVADIGCGRQQLTDYLAPGSVYLPSDLRAWDDGVEACDLNAGRYPEKTLACADIVAMMGVLDFIIDLPALFQKLCEHVELLGVTYHDSESGRALSSLRRHTYTPSEFTDIINAAGFKILRTVPWHDEKIWFAENTTPSKKRQALRAEAQRAWQQPATGMRTNVWRRLTHLV